MAKAFKTPGDAVKAQAAAYNLSITQLAEGIKVSPSAARLLINNKLRISISFAQRLSKFFGKTPKYWIDLQIAYELSLLGADKKEAAVLKTISKAEKAPAVKKSADKTTAKKAAAGKAGAKKTVGRKAAAKPAAARKTTAKKAAAATRKAPVKKAGSAPRGRKPAKQAADPKPASVEQTSLPWTPNSDN
jgi:addiction module HigA family antidote